MNSVERVRAALRREPVDRVPVMEFVVDEQVARAAVPGCRDAADCMDRLDMDAVACGASFPPVRENPDGSYVDEWGVTYRRGPEAVAHPVAGPIRTMADARAWRAPDPEAPGRLGKLPELVRRYQGRRAICFHHRAAFMWSAYLLGMEEILAGFLVEPALVALVMDKVLEANIAVVRRAIRAGAEVIVLGDDYAHNGGPMMSPAVFGEFIAPRLARMIAAIHEEGALVIKHSDGNLYPILDAIVSAGPDGLNPMEPVAGMTIRKTKALVGGRVCLSGNIDCAHLLPHGTVAQVREAVRQAIADGAPGGGFILSSSNSIHSSCRPENFATMVRAAREFGGRS
ncbi:MAG TPA: uroporphyrinogen decarboxylase family protein [Planctomycetota bacterium]|nr:uroporphyrinogen decarboxylase family protein [Planctomycetota bacterium]